MAGDPDDMWKPGFVGDAVRPAEPVVTAFPAEVDATTSSWNSQAEAAATSRPSVTLAVPGVEQIEFDAPRVDEPSAPVLETRSPRRGLAAAVVVVAALVIGALVVTRRGVDLDRPDVGEVPGADSRRIAQTVDPLWSTTLNERRLEQGPREFLVHDGAIVAVLDDEGDGSVAVGVDSESGVVRWRRRFDFLPSAVRILGGFDDVVVVERNDVVDRALFALDIADGAIRWELNTADNGIHLVLNGTNVITRVSFTGNERLTFVDPATGVEVGRVEGRRMGSDLSGTWYVANNRRVVSIDLVAGWSEPVEVVASGVQFDEPVGVIAGRVLVVDDGVLSEVSTVDGQRTPLVIQPFGQDIVDGSLIATGGSSFIAVGDGKVVGATLDPETAVVTIGWTKDAAMRSGAITERGVVVTMTTDMAGSTERLIVDASSGLVIVENEVPSTEIDVPYIVRDGVVVTQTELGRERVGYDLDGNELWRLAAPGTMRLGDEILVTLEDTPDGFRISAFG